MGYFIENLIYVLIACAALVTFFYTINKCLTR